MRGAGRIGGKNWKVPPSKKGGKNYDPFMIPEVGDLPVAPTLEPINDDWSISNFNEPVDPRDCSKYPASPYCGENPFRFGHPIGFDFEIKTNGCETCLYIYPVVAWMKLTPTIICYRDPNCNRKPPSTAPQSASEMNLPDIPPNCTLTIILSRGWRQGNEDPEDLTKFPTDVASFASEKGIEIPPNNGQGWTYGTTHALFGFGHLSTETARFYYETKGFDFPHDGYDKKAVTEFFQRFFNYSTGSNNGGNGALANLFGLPLLYTFQELWADWRWGFRFLITPKDKPPFEIKPPKVTPPPPPPFNDEDDDMCCNECSESAELSRKLLKEIQALKKSVGDGIAKVPKFDVYKDEQSKDLTEAIAKIWNLSRRSANALGTGDISETLKNALKSAVGIGTPKNLTAGIGLLMSRLGADRYPIEVPESLLTGVGDKVQNVDSITDYLYWLTHQLDALIGEFPVDIEIKDIDPLVAGDQSKKIQLPNLAESIAEIYGLSLKNTVQQEVEQAMLLRLATEVIAVKNGVAITQDYVKANTKFLGYRGNPAARELSYNFDFSSIDLNNKEQTVTIDKVLKTTKGYVQGWENEDKDTAQNFFQKLMFSAGIIKAVFFRDKKQVKEMGKQAQSMLQDDLNNNKKWKEFLSAINSSQSEYNKDQNEIPEITEEKRDINKPL
jgi:hypothetical protein